jgi:hypothetical protein
VTADALGNGAVGFGNHATASYAPTLEAGCTLLKVVFFVSLVNVYAHSPHLCPGTRANALPVPSSCFPQPSSCALAATSSTRSAPLLALTPLCQRLAGDFGAATGMLLPPPGRNSPSGSAARRPSTMPRRHG